MGMPVENSSGGKKRTEENSTAYVCVCVCVWEWGRGIFTTTTRTERERAARVAGQAAAQHYVTQGNQPSSTFFRLSTLSARSEHTRLCVQVCAWVGMLTLGQTQTVIANKSKTTS